MISKINQSLALMYAYVPLHLSYELYISYKKRGPVQTLSSRIFGIIQRIDTFVLSFTPNSNFIFQNQFACPNIFMTNRYQFGHASFPEKLKHYNKLMRRNIIRIENNAQEKNGMYLSLGL